MNVTLNPKNRFDPTAYMWTSSWTPPTAATPHVLTFQKREKGVTIFEVAIGNAAIQMGQKAYPTITNTVSVVVPFGWVCVEDCPRPLPTAWFPMHETMRRYALYPANDPSMRQEALRQAAMPVDPIKAKRMALAYGPANMPLPMLTVAQAHAGQMQVANYLGLLRSHLANGTTGQVEDSEDGLLTASVAGWRPWGIQSPGAPAGSGIRFWTGWEQCSDLGPYLWLATACNHERRWHAYNRANGAVITADNYPDPGPMYQQNTGDANNGWLPEFKGVAQHPDPILPPYDFAHSVRGFRHLVALSELVDSPMVRRALKSMAAQFRLQYSERGPHPSGGYSPPALRTSLGWAKSNPHNGQFGKDIGRQHGWPALAIAQSIKKGCSENIPWGKMLVELADTAAMPNGIFPRAVSNEPSDVWYDPDHDLAHAFEVPIFWMGVVGCARQTNTPVPQAVYRSMEAMYVEAPKWDYYSNEKGPPNYLYVAKRGGAPYPSIPSGKASNVPPGDASHVMTGASLAIDDAMRKNEPMLVKKMLDASSTVGAVYGTWQQKRAAFQSYNDLSAIAGLLAQMQKQP